MRSGEDENDDEEEEDAEEEEEEEEEAEEAVAKSVSDGRFRSRLEKLGEASVRSSQSLESAPARAPAENGALPLSGRKEDEEANDDV